ncbi:MAG TPA: ComEC/Rec2 family competence protein [Candidatus Saccharimonadales bacterium]|nr:ComEC/Rec2 family competence protein [Candidatus Saccharimonadales bacterium]
MFHKIVHHRFRRATILTTAGIALLAGLAGGQHMAASIWLPLMFMPLLIISWRSHNLITLLSLVIVAGCMGMWRGALFASKMHIYDAVTAQKVELVATALTDAVYDEHYQLTFDAGHAQLPTGETLPGTLTLSGFGASAVFKGDTVRVSGKLRRARGNNVARISYAQITVLAHHTSPVDVLRRKFAAGMQSVLPEPVASFGMGILIGQRNTLPEAVSTQLTMVGLTHIIAVSGYNLTIILRAVGRLLQKRSKFQYLAISLSLIGMFLLLTGNSPSIVRAAVVCCLGLAAWFYGRTVQPLVLLLVAASITGWANPLYVWGNVSWYLSFLAFFGVLVLSPVITRRLYGSREPGFLAAIVLESLCAEAMTLPYVLYIFGQMSTVSTLANVLVAALIPPAMLLSLFAGLAGMLAPAWLGWLAWPAMMLMTYMLDIAALLSRVPHAFLEHIGFSLSMLLASYGIVGGVLLLMRAKNARNYAIITDKTQLAPPAPDTS